MNRTEVLNLLQFAAAIDKRTIGEADVAAWHLVLAPLDYGRATAAVVAHFRQRPGVYLEPGHVWAGARTTTDGERDETAVRRAALEAALDATCEQGSWCHTCDAVHHVSETCEALRKRPEDHARVIEMFRPRAVHSAPHFTRHRQPDVVPAVVDDTAATAMEAERRRQLDALAAMAEQPQEATL